MSTIVFDNYKKGTIKAMERAMKGFNEWRGNEVISEESLLHYFEEQSQKKVATTLWTEFSHIKKYLEIMERIKLGKCSSIVVLLKSLNKKHVKKQSKSFSKEELFNYFRDAPNEGETLCIKLVAALGYYFTARTCELVGITFDHISTTKEGLLIHIVRSKTDGTNLGENKLLPKLLEEKICPILIYQRYVDKIPE